jgi:hypothetical protein
MGLMVVRRSQPSSFFLGEYEGYGFTATGKGPIPNGVKGCASQLSIIIGFRVVTQSSFLKNTARPRERVSPLMHKM